MGINDLCHEFYTGGQLLNVAVDILADNQQERQVLRAGEAGIPVDNSVESSSNWAGQLLPVENFSTVEESRKLS